MPVDDHRRVRLVPLQDALPGRADRPEPGVAEVRLRIGRRVPRRQQQGVALRSGTSSDSARRTTMARPGRSIHFDELDVPLRGSGPQREFQLADPAAAAPFAQRGGQAAGLAGPAGAAIGPCLGGHTAVFTSPPASWPFPRGNCRAAAPPAPSKDETDTPTPHGDFMTAIDPGDLVRRYVAIWSRANLRAAPQGRPRPVGRGRCPRPPATRGDAAGRSRTGLSLPCSPRPRARGTRGPGDPHRTTNSSHRVNIRSGRGIIGTPRQRGQIQLGDDPGRWRGGRGPGLGDPRPGHRWPYRDRLPVHRGLTREGREPGAGRARGFGAVTLWRR